MSIGKRSTTFSISRLLFNFLSSRLTFKEIEERAMNKFTKFLLPALALGVSSHAVAQNTYLTPTVEKGLIKVCKTAAKDQLHQMHLTMKKQDWSFRQMSLNVMCNGQDLISFAERYGAKKTTAKLIKSIGNISVTDIASTRDYNFDVSFEFDQAN